MAICHVWFQKISIPHLFPFPWNENLMGFVRGKHVLSAACTFVMVAWAVIR